MCIEKESITDEVDKIMVYPGYKDPMAWNKFYREYMRGSRGKITEKFGG